MGDTTKKGVDDENNDVGVHSGVRRSVSGVSSSAASGLSVSVHKRDVADGVRSLKPSRKECAISLRLPCELVALLDARATKEGYTSRGEWVRDCLLSVLMDGNGTDKRGERD